VGVDEHSTLVP